MACTYKYEYYVGDSYISTKDYDEFGRLEYAEENGVTSYYFYDNRNNLIRSVVSGSCKQKLCKA